MQKHIWLAIKYNLQKHIKLDFTPDKYVFLNNRGIYIISIIQFCFSNFAPVALEKSK